MNADHLGEISRREFMRDSALAGGVSALGAMALSDSLHGASVKGPNPDWFDRPMRWAQLTLVENDPAHYDPKFWLDYFKRTHSDAACLSAGGCVAYYPTQIPLHYRSKWMGDGDPFGELVAGCREMGMIVLARTDSHAVHQDVYDAHPEWIAVDSAGQKRPHWSSPEMWVTCALGPYNFEFMTEVQKEVMSLYMVDGIFTNRWAGSGMCYCEHCQANFDEFCGLQLPRTSDPQAPERRNYILWRQERLFELWRHWDEEIRRINPHARYIANAGGGALSTLDMKTIGEMADILFADRQARRGVMLPWANGKNAKEYRAALGRKPIGGIFSVGVEESYRWKDSVQNEAEIRIWVLDGIANGLRPWFTKFSGTLHDKRWLGTVERIYKWHHRVEKYLRNEEPLARVAMVYSQQTAWFYGGSRAREKVEDHSLGMYQAMIEARVPFEMVHDRMLDEESMDRFKLLILPNIAALSDEQCGQIRNYVKRGGSILATHETSLYDEWGKQRPDFGLADLFGAQFQGSVDGPNKNSYLRLEMDPAGEQRHPILTGLEDASRIINGGYWVHAEPTQNLASNPLTWIPPYPDLPMEKVYPRQPKTDVPAVYLREQGKSRIVYFPWDVDRVFWEVLCVDHGRLLANAVAWAANEQQPVTAEGPGIVDLTVWRQKESMTVHLVNLTNPMMMKGPFRELMPIGEQKLTIRLPKGKRARRVQLLTANSSPPFQQLGDRIVLTVPSILDLEVVAIDL